MAAMLVVGALGWLLRSRVTDALADRVDRQLVERAATAPILAAVGDRLAVSELAATVEGARVQAADAGSPTTEIGLLPADDLPPVVEPGWQTARADGQDWRLYTVEVADVPETGDRTLVQLVAPLGDVDALARDQRRDLLLIAVGAVAGSAAVGYGLGALAARPLSRLRRDAAAVGTGPPGDWRVGDHYGAAEVDDVAHVLNDGLDRLAVASERREASLEAARAFAATAAHELRTPLTSALTNLDIVRAVRPEAVDPSELSALVGSASHQLRRATATLAALRDLADAQLADPSWFTEFDLGDDVAVLVSSEIRRHPGVALGVELPDVGTNVVAWRDGVRIAASNLVRNALAHGRPTQGSPEIRITVSGDDRMVSVEVADNGPGIAAADRERLRRRFERGDSSAGEPGFGVGLALADQVATLHGGELTITDRPGGGAAVRFTLRRDAGSQEL